MHILVTGGTGFIGSALIPALKRRGDRVTVLSRKSRQNTRDVAYVQQLTDIETPVDAVINLAGASLAAKRWSDRYKAEIVASRVGLTERLVSWMKAQPQSPKVLLSGSAIGYYGTSGTTTFTEASLPGTGFAAELCQAWESAASVADDGATRVVQLRLGVVFDRDGGALQEMMRSFRFGVGSWVGSGSQWLSWVHRADVVRAILLLLEDERAQGPFNVVAPNALTHRQFCETLSARKPTLFSAGVPGFLLRAMVGEMADELLLNGQRVLPEKLEALGFEFRFESLDSALIDILSRTKN